MSETERHKLYQTIVDKKPETVFEIGTWKGGGSTYFISSALATVGSGKLTTVEANVDFYNHARNLYDNNLKELAPYINFNFGKSDVVYPAILNKLNSIDVVLFDGDQSYEQTDAEYELFKNHLKSGSIAMFHDWHTGKVGDNLKTIMGDLDVWNPLCIMGKADQSTTGFAIFEKV
jgi:predicted O-methyltransferase YrrM